MSPAGHIRTVSALLRRTFFPTQPPPSQPWSTTLVDPKTGTHTLSGRLARPEAATDLVVLVHGLGGSSESGYLLSSARAAHALGMASLRFNLRGADGLTGDFYHGGLTADLHAAVAGLGTLGFERIFVLGFSLGGHVALRFATEDQAPGVAALAAICSPLDLRAGADAMDRPHMAVYRRYVLRRLLANYENTARLGTYPTLPGDLRPVRTIRQWDTLTVVPRFEFDNADDYYARASVGPRLARLKCPTLLLATEDDPMVPPSAIRPALDKESSPSPLLTVRWLEKGGHLGFAKHLDLGFGRPLGVAAQALFWLRREARSRNPRLTSPES